MTTFSQHPEIQVTPEIRDAVERVHSGIERVIIVTDLGGEPLAALVSLTSLRLLDDRDVAQGGEAALEDDDAGGMRLR